VGVYVALLRGINVGGKNLIKMPALKECFEADGFEDVTTYIASGNVLFRGSGSTAALAARIENILSKSFDHYQASVVIKSRTQMRSIVEKAPKGFGKKPDTYHSDVCFLKDSLVAATALKQVDLREGVDNVWAGRGVLYFQRLTAKRTQSRMGKMASLPIYKSMTIRSWSTTARLQKMLDDL
jgi:uncharacterized protein (DUF1697 family)